MPTSNFPPVPSQEPVRREDAVLERIAAILEDDSWYGGYDALVGAHPNKADLLTAREGWLDFANSYPSTSQTAKTMGIVEHPLPVIVEPPIGPTILDAALASAQIDTQEIGSTGESIVIQLEQKRLISAGRSDLAKRVKKIPDQLGAGYDIQSFEDDERKRLIEVKTTRSLNSVIINTFTMTPNEWMTAESTRDAYFIYRVTLSDKEGIRVSILCDPVGRYKKDQISMTPRDGAIVRYNDDIAEQLDITK